MFKKSVATRQAVLDAALELFREHGYEKTTMRAIAAAAGVSVGNAYYYFRSKDDLVQHFYADIQAAHRAAVDLRGTGPFSDRLRRVLHAGLDVMAPYHAFAGSFVKVAIEPGAAASPLSPASAPARDAAIGLFALTVDGSTLRADPALRAELPELLWLGYLALTLLWVHDPTPEQARTRRFVDAVVPVVARLVALSRVPAVRPVTRELLGLVRMVRPA